MDQYCRLATTYEDASLSEEGGGSSTVLISYVACQGQR